MSPVGGYTCVCFGVIPQGMVRFCPVVEGFSLKLKGTVFPLGVGQVVCSYLYSYIYRTPRTSCVRKSRFTIVKNQLPSKRKIPGRCEQQSRVWLPTMHLYDQVGVFRIPCDSPTRIILVENRLTRFASRSGAVRCAPTYFRFP